MMQKIKNWLGGLMPSRSRTGNNTVDQALNLIEQELATRGDNTVQVVQENISQSDQPEVEVNPRQNVNLSGSRIFRAPSPARHRTPTLNEPIYETSDADDYSGFASWSRDMDKKYLTK